MRQAMAEAAVGDDVFQDDPTVRELEQQVAARFGKRAALFVPTGCQGNQIAANIHTQSGQEVVVGDTSHTLDWELGGLAAISGLQVRPVPSYRGVLDVPAVTSLLRDAGGFRPACKLLMVENTHNFHGGAVVPLEHLQELKALAEQRGARVHLDGARIWNAATASGISLAEYGAVADSLMACFSKGLGAPIGSIIAGDEAFIAEAREVRKLLGGGMRQVGVITAPALLALDGYEDRLAQDHARARRLAEGFCDNAGVSTLYGPVETNIVFVKAEGRDAARIQEALAAADVLAIATGADVLRFVTHCDVNDDHVERALRVFGETVQAA